MLFLFTDIQTFWWETRDPDRQDLFIFHENHSICSQSQCKECSQALLALASLHKRKKGLWFPDVWQTAHTKLRKVQYPVYSKADPAETSPLLWRAADRVTTWKQVRQNSFVLQAYFDIGLFGGSWMSRSRLWKHQVAPQGDFKSDF